MHFADTLQFSPSGSHMHHKIECSESTAEQQDLLLEQLKYGPDGQIIWRCASSCMTPSADLRLNPDLLCRSNIQMGVDSLILLAQATTAKLLPIGLWHVIHPGLRAVEPQVEVLNLEVHASKPRALYGTLPCWTSWLASDQQTQGWQSQEGHIRRDVTLPHSKFLQFDPHVPEDSGKGV